MYRVNKRDGKIADFDIAKISEAIKKAFEACERQYNDNIIDLLHGCYVSMWIWNRNGLCCRHYGE